MISNLANSWLNRPGNVSLTAGKSPSKEVIMKTEFQVLTEDGVTVIVLAEEYDNLNPQHLELVSKNLLDLAQSVTPPLVVFDMSATKFFGSVFLGSLFRFWRRITTRNGKMACCGATGVCQQVLDITQADKLWTMSPTREQAIRRLKQS
jgi:anti-anti-sigma factor